MKNLRVVVTAAGVVCSCGTGKEKFWDALTKGTTGLAPIRRFDASRLATRIGGEVELANLTPPPAIDRHPWDAVKDTKAFLAWEAIRQISHLVPQDSGLITTVGLERIDLEVISGRHAPGALICPEVPPVILPGILWRKAGFSGPVSTQVAACAAGTLAIGAAFRMIRNGLARYLVAGGVDSLLFPFGIHAFNSIGALSETNDRGGGALMPFDRHRTGTLLGEGAGYLLLEESGQAIRDGREPLAEILGFGGSMDAFHPVMPDPTGRGATMAMIRALEDARLTPDRVDYINAHGTGTWHNDLMEAKAILNVFGDRGRVVPVSSSKSFFGHLLTAAGAVEAVASLLPFTRGVLPPTLHWQTRDPEIPLDCVPEAGRETNAKIVMSNSYGLGGQNASLIIGRWNQ